MRLFLNCMAASAGGGLTYLKNIIPQLSSRRDLRATVAIRDDLKTEFDQQENLSILPLTAPISAFRRFYFEQNSLPQIIRESRADVLICAGNFALRRSPTPQILLSGNSLYNSADFFRDLRQRREYRMWIDTRLRSYFARQSVHWANCTVAPSQSFADQLHTWTGSYIQCIHHGFDPQIFFADQTSLPPDVQSKLDSGEGKLRLLFVSHYNYYRNFETLFRAMPQLCQRLGKDNVRLFLTCKLGPNENPGSFDPSAARKLVRKLGIAEQVIELGAIPYHHLHKVYRACDMYVTPAYAETFAFPLVEAMACGVPIVASDLSVHREITAGGAQFFPAFSPDELAEQVILLAKSRELKQKQIDAGLKRAADFSWAKHVDELLSLARTLV